MLGKPGQRDVPDGEACLCVGSPEQMHKGCSLLLSCGGHWRKKIDDKEL